MDTLVLLFLSTAASVLISALLIRSGWLSAETAMVIDLQKQVEWLTRERNALLADLAAANRTIAALQATVARLEAQVTKAAPHVVVLGIWAGDGLALGEERDAVYDAGVEYRALFGDQATRSNILRELRQGGITCLEIGAHGDAEALLIAGQQLGGGWWQRVLTGRSINVALILACFSDSSVADAMRRAGVQHVIAAAGALDDTAAVEFARQFYQLYAAGMDVPRAFEEAKLALDYRQAELLVLR